jgi:hypothetical protein
MDQRSFSNVLPVLLLIFGIPQSCFEVALTWCFREELDLMITRDTKEQFPRLSRNVRNNHNTTRSELAESQGWYWWYHNSSRNKEGVSHHEFDWYLRTNQYIDGDHEKFCREAIWRCLRTATSSSKRNDEAKAFGTTDTTQARNQACCLRWYNKMKKIDVSFVPRRKLLRA